MDILPKKEAGFLTADDWIAFYDSMVLADSYDIDRAKKLYVDIKKHRELLDKESFLMDEYLYWKTFELGVEIDNHLWAIRFIREFLKDCDRDNEKVDLKYFKLIDDFWHMSQGHVDTFRMFATHSFDALVKSLDASKTKKTPEILIKIREFEENKYLEKK